MQSRCKPVYGTPTSNLLFGVKNWQLTNSVHKSAFIFGQTMERNCTIPDHSDRFEENCIENYQK